MSLFDSVNCFNSSEMKRLYNDYSDKSLKDVNFDDVENIYETDSKKQNYGDADNIWEL